MGSWWLLCAPRLLLSCFPSSCSTLASGHLGQCGLIWLSALLGWLSLLSGADLVQRP